MFCFSCIGENLTNGFSERDSSTLTFEMVELVELVELVYWYKKEN